MVMIELIYHTTMECLDYFIALKKKHTQKTLIIFQLCSPLIDKEIPMTVNSIFISIEIELRKMQLSKYKQMKVVNLPHALITNELLVNPRNFLRKVSSLGSEWLFLKF